MRMKNGDSVESITIPRVILYLEFMALLIGLAIPITPSKTGSDGSLAEWFIDDPGYLEEVFVYFVLTNVLLGLLLLIAWVWHRFGTPADGVADASGPDSGDNSDE